MYVSNPEQQQSLFGSCDRTDVIWAYLQLDGAASSSCSFSAIMLTQNWIQISVEQINT